MKLAYPTPTEARSNDPETTTPETRHLSRRSVLVGLVGAAGSALGCGGEDQGGSGATGSGGTAAGSGGASATGPGSGGQGGAGATGGEGVGGHAAGVGGAGSCPTLDPACEPTEDNIEGPYYRPGAPFTNQLDNPSGEGERLVISGIVYASDCVTPLGGAIVEVWQADAAGHYDNEGADPGPNVWVLRASIETDPCGRYEYESVIPGRYLNGPEYRPAHIHYRATHADVSEPFITQMYFDGDPFNDSDAFFKPSLAIALVEEQGPDGPRKRGVFDVVLAS
jgi:catechol 1,2-dioxygenase